jgi:hypothetical protein
MKAQRLEELLIAWEEDSLTPDELAELKHALATEPSARQRLVEVGVLHSVAQGQVRAWAAAQPARESSSTGARRIVFGLNWLTWRPLTALAASLVLAALLGALFLAQASARPATIVQRALKAHAAALDRCYRVSGGWDAPRRDEAESARRETRVWTRGDRFWVEVRAEGRPAAWGRDEQGRIWFTSSPDAGGWFDADEVPERLAQVCDLRSLQPESLLRSMLADFDLRREPDAAGNHLIHAELKPGREHPLYHGALLEMDAASGVLRRAVVERVAPGRSRVPVTFTLVESGLLDDASYTLAGHLSADAEIYERHSPAQRARALAEFLRLLTGRDRANR